MRTSELISAGKYKMAEARFLAVDAAKANRRKRILYWAKAYSDTAIDQQNDPEHAGDLPGYRDCLEMDMYDALRERIPNISARECEIALAAFRAALPTQFQD